MENGMWPQSMRVVLQVHKTFNAARKLRINTPHYFHVMMSFELLEEYTSAIVEADPSQLQEVFPSQPILRSPAERRNALEHGSTR